MADLTLPGDIQGGLRSTSPVVLTVEVFMGDYWSATPGARGVVLRLEEQDGVQGAECAFGPENSEGDALVWVPLSSLALDLSDPTGRAHAWAYLADNGGTLWWGEVAAALGIDTDRIDRAMHHAMRWVDMTPGEIDILRRVVLHVAGRTND